MTQRERFLACLRGERPGHILYTADFTPDLQRRLEEHCGTKDLAGHFGFFQPVEVGPKPPAGYKPFDYSVYFAGEKLAAGTTLDDNGVAMVPSGFYHFWGFVSPLRNAESIELILSYPIPDRADWLTGHLAAEAAAARSAGRAVSTWVGHMYESAWQVRGYEQFLMDMIERPEWAEAMLDKFFRRNMVTAVAAARAGADFLFCGDDVANQNAMMFSVPMWRQFMLSRWRQVWAAARSIKPDIHIWYHSDGNIAPIVDELREAGVTILNPIQPECLSPFALREKYPDLNMWGCLGTQSTMPFGKPADVRKAVSDLAEQVGSSGRLILAPTHVLEPEVPIENIEAFVEEARRH